MRVFAELLHRVRDSDILYSFMRTPTAVVAAAIAIACVIIALFAPVIAPYDPYDLASINLLDANRPPIGFEHGTYAYLFGTDHQGRDIFSAVVFGMRVSMMVAAASVLFASLLGITLGLIGGYFGGAVDSIIMRIADVQLSFPAILIALTVDGAARAIVSVDLHDFVAVYVIIVSIGLAYWVQFARTVRGMTMVEKNKEYVLAAQIMGVSPLSIMLKHILINVLEPVLAAR